MLHSPEPDNGTRPTMSEAVLLREIPTACGRRFGHATLNAERSLNALSLPMIDLLAPRLDAWAADPGIVGVVLDGAGDKAFCAGGDVAALWRAIKTTPPGAVAPEAEAFFEREYRLDHRIHTYPKPILCWGHGIVMGGGVGLMAGASHRVATPQTRLAMPEITIGLYPDVGGSWFLRRMPGRAGLFLALTGAALNAADARFAGLADFVLDHGARAGVIAALGATRWGGDADADRRRLDHLLGEFALRDGLPASPLRTHFDRIEALVGRGGLADIAGRLAALAGDADPWLADAAARFAHGAPSSAALSHALWRRARHLSLAEVFRLEYVVSLAGTHQADFIEGVRALLIDKDRRPRWRHVGVEAVDAEYLADHFRPRFAGAHPLADLE